MPTRPAAHPTLPHLLHRWPKRYLAVGCGEVALDGGGGEQEGHALAQQAKREGVAVLRGGKAQVGAGQVAQFGGVQ